MSLVRAIISAESHQAHLKEKKKILILKFVSIGLMVLIFLPTTLYVIIVLKMDTLGRVMLYLRAVSMFIPTCIAFPLFISNLMFYKERFEKEKALTRK